MYLAIDIGGTKTLVACMSPEGVIKQQVKFPTNKSYAIFRYNLANIVEKMSTNKFNAVGVAAPGRINREQGIGIAMGNLPWKNVPLKRDLMRITKCEKVIVENDAKAAGLAEAILLKKQFNRVLYVTIGTGIGTALIVNQKIDPALANAEGGKILLQYGDHLTEWEDLASGRAIVERFGKRASEITKKDTWGEIAHLIALGLFDILATLQPQVVVIGGGVSEYFASFDEPLQAELKRYETPLVPIPPLRQAGRPNDAVLYGCHALARSAYGNSRS